ncbi:hypothetical protein M569_13557, partial [Genlisea aurea]
FFYSEPGPRFFIHSVVSDCGKDDPDLKTETEKEMVDLMKLKRKLEEEGHCWEKRAKCVHGTRDAMRLRKSRRLIRQKKLTILWEQRARQLGW